MVSYIYSDIQKVIVGISNLVFQDYSYLLQYIQKLSPVETSFFRVNGMSLKQYWDKNLTKKQSKKFNKIYMVSKDIPLKMQQLNDKLDEINFSEITVKYRQYEEFNDMFIALVEAIINKYEFPEKIATLPKTELKKICALRLSVFLQLRRFVKKVFTMPKRILNYTKESLHEEWNKRQEIDKSPWWNVLKDGEPGLSEMFDEADKKDLERKELLWNRFIEDEEAAEYKQLAENIFSKKLTALNFNEDFIQYLGYEKKIKTVEDFVGLKYETAESLIEDAKSYFKKSKDVSVKIITEKVYESGLGFGIKTEDFAAVCNSTDPEILADSF